MGASSDSPSSPSRSRPASCAGSNASNARSYLAGLVAALNRKNTESIAYRHDQQRHGLQYFVGSSARDHISPLLRELARQVGRELGTPDGVIVFRPLGLPQAGRGVGGRAAAVVRTAGEGRLLSVAEIT
jgi:hypothetical protein